MEATMAMATEAENFMVGGAGRGLFGRGGCVMLVVVVFGGGDCGRLLADDSGRYTCVESARFLSIDLMQDKHGDEMSRLCRSGSASTVQVVDKAYRQISLSSC
jgi:hypothetical protein